MALQEILKRNPFQLRVPRMFNSSVEVRLPVSAIILIETVTNQVSKGLSGDYAN